MATNVRSLEDPVPRVYGRRYVWEVPVRLTHWLDATAVVVLVATGLLIARPQLSPIGEPFDNFWMGRIREVHFIFAYILTISFLLRIYWFFRGSQFARSGFPRLWQGKWWRTMWEQLMAYTHLERGRVTLGHDSLAGASYAVFILLGFFQMLTGFAIFSQVNRGGLWDRLTGWVIPLLGGSFQTQMWHHLVAWGIVLFVIFHLYSVFYNSRLWRNGLVDSIVSGFKFYEKDDAESD